MTTVTFDTLKFVETLKASGFDDSQAKGMAQAIRDVHSFQVEELVAKRDLKALEGQVATKADVARVELQILEVKRDLKELELRMVIKTGGMVLAGIGILLGLMRVWPIPVQYPPVGQEPRLASPPHPGSTGTTK